MNTMKYEKRRLELPSELKASGDGKTITGVFPTGVLTDLGCVDEIIHPSAFDESLRSGKNLFFLMNHDTAKPVANTSAGTLNIFKKSDGIHFTASLDRNVNHANDLYLCVERGDISGVSVGFSIIDSENDATTQIIKQAELHEISAVTFPAYEKSKISSRNKDMNEFAMQQEMRQLEQRIADFIANPNTDKIAQNKKEQSRVKELEQQFEAIKESRAIHDRMNEVEDPGVMSPMSGRIEVEDKPIYRGKYALGQQMADAVALARDPSDPAARSHHEQMVAREKILAEKRAAGTGGMIQGVSSDGGILLQGETSMDMIQNGFNNSAILSRCETRDIGGLQKAELIGLDETSRADNSRQGGIRVYTDKEVGQMTQSKTKFDKIELQPQKLTGLYFASDEILMNAPLLTAEMDSVFRNEFALKAQDLIVRGSGSGETLGITVADCLAEVAKETDQEATTIVFENLVKMKSRLKIRDLSRVIWVAHQDVEPLLYQLSLPVGTGGSVMPVYNPVINQADGTAGTLLGIPIVFIEQCESLGAKNDIMLYDFSMYYVATRGGIESASSIHLKFDYNQTTFRFVYYFDGQPRLKNAITPYKGSNTVSPFVTLAARS